MSLPLSDPVPTQYWLRGRVRRGGKCVIITFLISGPVCVCAARTADKQKGPLLCNNSYNCCKNYTPTAFHSDQAHFRHYITSGPGFRIQVILYGSGPVLWIRIQIGTVFSNFVDTMKNRGKSMDIKILNFLNMPLFLYGFFKDVFYRINLFWKYFLHFSPDRYYHAM